ncbi:SRPBCC family protein [Carboxylicivirga marina]|uniref:SRPBCC family protein n=1 Tax=Carboxylicivirga marina TaxID=2800988 RepID=UPI002594939C|nr:SRPBCC domain-containing protein [uncultured Carboxylicivirga sp.]
MEADVIICQEEFNCSTKKLWQAITKVEEMRQWFFDNIPAFKAELGFETSFMVDAGERKFMHVWKIVDVKEEELIKYQWTYDGFDGVGYVTFELNEMAGRTRLILTNEGLETFRPKVPEFTRENCENGWRYFIKERLKSYIA